MEKREIKKIMKETCFCSLAFGCTLDKECDSRDSVLRKLGLKRKEFIKLKENFDNDLFKLLEER